MKTLLLLPALLLVLLCCKKQEAEPDLPPETQIGANTFGCRFNGRAWVPDPTKDKPLNVCNALVTEFGITDQSRYFSVTATNCKLGGFVRLFSNVTNQPGIHPIVATSGTAVDIGDNVCVYYSSDKDTYCRGSITLTRVDYPAGILSGTFAFTIHKPGCDTLRVTDGRFDLKSN